MGVTETPGLGTSQQRRSTMARTKTPRPKNPIQGQEAPVHTGENIDVAIAWVLATEEGLREEAMDIGAAWLGRRVAIPCTSAYECEDGYTVTPESAAGGRFSFREAPVLVATPLEDYSALRVADILSIVKAHQGEANAARYLDAGAQASGMNTVVFATAESPDDWIGLVSFTCRAAYGTSARVLTEHHLTFVHPNYRGHRLGCAISGMCGFLLSDALMLGFFAERRILDSRSVRIEARGERGIAYGDFLIRSFCGGVAFLISEPEMWDLCLDEDEDGELEVAMEVDGGAAIDFLYEGPLIA
jgi:GNAT superfamily N-acetyltransferase